ncbi:MAG: hypothetical protein ABIO83_05640 [Ilumatobacteraceae bacterium]
MILPIDSHLIADLDRIGFLIDDGGLATVPQHLLRTVVDDAKQLGVRPVAVRVLEDGTDPIVVRERAFGLVAASIANALDARI